jgi:D-alanine-D-alanine ligase-like ATP-grasp enzyme
MTARAVKPACEHCGAAPTSHPILWIDTAISIFFDASLRTAFKPFIPLLTPFVRSLTNTGIHSFFLITRLMGYATFSDAYPTKECNRKKVIFDEAKTRGIRMQIINFRGKEISYARALLPARKGSARTSWHYFEYIPIPPWKDSPLTQNLDNKSELKRLCEKHNLRVPRGGPALFRHTALGYFKKYAPVIVKPLEGSRARHTRVRVEDEQDFLEAYKRAKEICPVAMVEEFIDGDVHRATCVDGKLVAVMRFVRPSIVSDGHVTAEELRKQYNATLALPDVTPVADNALFAVTLRHQGYTALSTVPAGAVLRLADFSERTNGGYNEDVTDKIPESTRTYLERAASVSKLPVVGFDIITKDIANADELPAFLEANTAPFIEIHHVPTKGTPRNVAGPVWDLWF